MTVSNPYSSSFILSYSFWYLLVSYLVQVLQNTKYYGVLTCVPGMKKELLGKQMESLESFLRAMKTTLNEFDGIVKALEKLWQDGCQLLKGESKQPTARQMQARIGIRPSLSDCLEGLRAIHEMHHSEYLLKSSIIAAISLNSSSADLSAFHRLLADQPNIPREEVKFIFNIIFAEEIS
ncbi:uncharacterized protein At5g43822 isoform X2 [Amborella trichopoda]|uniref:uncharacterized protein At5g43822 isoform X2 n=1 Tax=Amborella trichopoda TaxID=13333 RepID=UPI0009C178E3|nr:uncharacterized protein At5g43822 isoform X2 [Amborella trichopoda]|eukprot:XP_020530010.1 uncharacterized protein At5g43822 isoform X2 [Amborella trichopoda]